MEFGWFRMDGRLKFLLFYLFCGLGILLIAYFLEIKLIELTEFSFLSRGIGIGVVLSIDVIFVMLALHGSCVDWSSRFEWAYRFCAMHTVFLMLGFYLILTASRLTGNLTVCVSILGATLLLYLYIGIAREAFSKNKEQDQKLKMIVRDVILIVTSSLDALLIGPVLVGDDLIFSGKGLLLLIQGGLVIGFVALFASCIGFLIAWFGRGLREKQPLYGRVGSLLAEFVQTIIIGYFGWRALLVPWDCGNTTFLILSMVFGSAFWIFFGKRIWIKSESEVE